MQKCQCGWDMQLRLACADLDIVCKRCHTKATTEDCHWLGPTMEMKLWERSEMTAAELPPTE
jgi:hypothetical protein